MPSVKLIQDFIIVGLQNHEFKVLMNIFVPTVYIYDFRPDSTNIFL